jgi:hypothetical protein
LQGHHPSELNLLADLLFGGPAKVTAKPGEKKRSF